MLTSNHSFQEEIHWLCGLIQQRRENTIQSLSDYDCPPSRSDTWSEIIFQKNSLSEDSLPTEEKLLLMLVLIPHLAPDLLEDKILYYEAQGFASSSDKVWYRQKQNLQRRQNFPYQASKFGLVRAAWSRSALPTGQTYLYLLAGDDLQQKIEAMHKIYQRQLLLLREGVVQIDDTHPAEPYPSGLLWIRPDYLVSFLAQVPIDQIRPYERIHP